MIKMCIETAFLVEEITKLDMFYAQSDFYVFCTVRDFAINSNKRYSRSYVHVTLLMT